jgi:protoporphyrinogen oxidase
MKVAVIGGGLLGLTLAFRLARRGHQVKLFEAANHLGGLAAPQRFGPITWDRYYHCILPQDTALLGLIDEIGLGADLRWKKTGTGYYAGGRAYDMSGNIDYLRFPLLTPIDKARLAATVLHASRTANPYDLYRITAEDWLTRWSGRRAYEAFWRPLLRAKFGPYYDKVAAVFIWATLTRLQGSGGKARPGHLGYVRGGYASILSAFRKKLESLGVEILLGAPVESLELSEDGRRVHVRAPAGGPSAEADQVFFTGPTRLARRAAAAGLLPVIERSEQRYPTHAAYLGVACLTLVLRRPLTPYYVLNIADPNVELTGLIEMTNLIDPASETQGYSLVYLPRYLDSNDPAFERSDAELVESLLERGVRRLFPTLSDQDIVERQLNRARYVQPLPLVTERAAGRTALQRLERPFAVLNTTMLECATLNNNEVVSLVDRYLEHWRAELH